MTPVSGDSGGDDIWLAYPNGNHYRATKPADAESSDEEVRRSRFCFLEDLVPMKRQRVGDAPPAPAAPLDANAATTESEPETQETQEWDG